MHRRELAGMGQGSCHSHPGTPKIRFIRPDVAVVNGDSYMAGLHDEQGKEFPPTTSRYTAVTVKENRRWMVAALRSLPHLKSSINPADVR